MAFCCCGGPGDDAVIERKNIQLQHLSAVGMVRCPPPLRQGEEIRVPVYLNVYSLLDSNKKLARIGMGVYHTGVVVYGIEWGYGEAVDNPNASGLFCVHPGQAAGTLHRTIKIGVTGKSPTQVDTILHRLENEWRSSDYHILHHNCNHFAQVFCDMLSTCEKLRVPPWCNRAARVTDRIVPKKLATKVQRMMDDGPPKAAPPPVPTNMGEIPTSVIPVQWYLHPSIMQPPRYSRVNSTFSRGSVYSSQGSNFVPPPGFTTEQCADLPPSNIPKSASARSSLQSITPPPTSQSRGRQEEVGLDKSVMPKHEWSQLEHESINGGSVNMVETIDDVRREDTPVVVTPTATTEEVTWTKSVAALHAQEMVKANPPVMRAEKEASRDAKGLETGKGEPQTKPVSAQPTRSPHTASLHNDETKSRTSLTATEEQVSRKRPQMWSACSAPSFADEMDVDSAVSENSAHLNRSVAREDEKEIGGEAEEETDSVASVHITTACVADQTARYQAAPRGSMVLSALVDEEPPEELPVDEEEAHASTRVDFSTMEEAATRFSSMFHKKDKTAFSDITGTHITDDTPKTEPSTRHSKKGTSARHANRYLDTISTRSEKADSTTKGAEATAGDKGEHEGVPSVLEQGEESLSAENDVVSNTSSAHAAEKEKKRSVGAVEAGSATIHENPTDVAFVATVAVPPRVSPVAKNARLPMPLETSELRAPLNKPHTSRSCDSMDALADTHDLDVLASTHSAMSPVLGDGSSTMRLHRLSATSPRPFHLVPLVPDTKPAAKSAPPTVRPRTKGWIEKPTDTGGNCSASEQQMACEGTTESKHGTQQQQQQQQREGENRIHVRSPTPPATGDAGASFRKRSVTEEVAVDESLNPLLISAPSQQSIQSSPRELQ